MTATPALAGAALTLLTCYGTVGDGSNDAGSRDAAPRDAASNIDRPAEAARDVPEGAGDDVLGLDLPAPLAVIDATTLRGKMLFGYQGWFGVPGDGSSVKEWHHWFTASTVSSALGFVVDMWPEVTELEADERFTTTGLALPGGAPATAFSSFKEKTVVRHFQWMRDHDLDGVFLQRFLSEVQDPRFFAFRNQVTRNVRAGAEAHGRVFAIEYDLSLPAVLQPMIVDKLKADWMYLVDTLKVTDSDRYLHDAGKPVVAVWGIGFIDRPTTPQQAQELINWFKTDAPAAYRATIIGGIPSRWRTQTIDAQTDPAWPAVFRSLDVISPWTVGRYADDAAADRFMADVVVPDMAETEALGIGYLPVVFPGFSWHNLKNSTRENQIPRRGGRFYWRQVTNLVGAGAVMMKTAMFDEVDEATAMFKLAPSDAESPAQASFVTLDEDGESLPSDWYLRVGRVATQVVRHHRPPTSTLPIVP
ncbi:MAG TPA: glycoside hydrolase family 71/99-like protein [Polyangia bacterium]|jgi:hypothetical protein|nr:glycoside hydrolase family 71/99-like protein [Polyangia bacterium]